MRGKELLQNMADIDNDLLLEAENAFCQKKKPIRIQRWIAVAACVCVCFCCALPALAAAGNRIAYEALYSISPSVAQRLTPVNVSCEDNGIELTVVAAEIDGEKANILVSMRDIAGNRLDETTDLFDSYSIHTPHDQIGGCTPVGYDGETRTATFLLTIEQMRHVLIPGDKITFSVSQLLTGKEHGDFALTQIDTENLPSVTEFAAKPDIRGGSNSGDEMRLLKPEEENAIALTPGVALTGYGIADGRLHIQLRYDDIHTTDNHGYVYLKTPDGEKLSCESSVAFWDDGRVNSYQEYIFPISSGGLAGYEVWGEFWICNGGPIRGDWRVTFPMTDAK